MYSAQALPYSILTRKVLVKGAFRDLRMLCEALDTGGVDAVAVEQGFRGAQDPLSSLVVAGWRHAEVVVAVHITGNYTDRCSYSRRDSI